MRQIRFRAWDNVKERMYYVGEETEVVFTFDSNGIVATDITESEDEFKTLHHLVYMQYTGLKDKNGKEIYEGDIVKGKRFGHDKEFHRHIGSVEWYDQRYVVNGVAKYKGWNNEELNRLYEVIGNIYEHHHLLEANHE